jgi:hypothetical protein
MGNAEGPVARTTTSFGFGRRTNGVLIAMRAELESRTIPPGPSFMIRPAGTRAERTKGSQGGFHRSGGTAQIRFWWWGSDPCSLPGGARLARADRQLADRGHPRVVRVAVARLAPDLHGGAHMDRRPPMDVASQQDSTWLTL